MSWPQSHAEFSNGRSSPTFPRVARSKILCSENMSLTAVRCYFFGGNDLVINRHLSHEIFASGGVGVYDDAIRHKRGHF